MTPAIQIECHMGIQWWHVTLFSTRGLDVSRSYDHAKPRNICRSATCLHGGGIFELKVLFSRLFRIFMQIIDTYVLLIFFTNNSE